MEKNRTFILEFFRRDLVYAIASTAKAEGHHLRLLTCTDLTEGDQMWLAGFGVSWQRVYPAIAKMNAFAAMVDSLPKKIFAIIKATFLALRFHKSDMAYIIVNTCFPLSRGLAILDRMGLVKVQYIPHGLHHAHSKLLGTNIIHFASVSQKQLPKRLSIAANPTMHSTPFIQSIYRASDIIKTLKASKENFTCNELLFIGGFEVDVKNESAISHYIDLLNELKERLSQEIPSLRFVYRPHPDPSYREFFERFCANKIKWDISWHSWTHDLTHACGVLSYGSAGLVEARDFGIPCLRLSPKKKLGILEYDLDLLNIRHVDNIKDAAKWAKENIVPNKKVIDVTRLENFLSQALEKLNKAIWQ